MCIIWPWTKTNMQNKLKVRIFTFISWINKQLWPIQWSPVHMLRQCMHLVAGWFGCRRMMTWYLRQPDSIKLTQFAPREEERERESFHCYLIIPTRINDTHELSTPKSHYFQQKTKTYTHLMKFYTSFSLLSSFQIRQHHSIDDACSSVDWSCFSTNPVSPYLWHFKPYFIEMLVFYR